MYSSDMYVAENLADATMSSAPMMGLFLGIIIFSIILGLISIISNWKLFNKAGKPGWASIVPIYNFIVMIQISKLSMVYLLLLLIPFVNIFAIFKINIAIAKKFGKSAGFGIGMTLFSIIFIPLLAFSDNTYEDNKVETETNNTFDATSVINNNVDNNTVVKTIPTEPTNIENAPINAIEVSDEITNQVVEPINNEFNVNNQIPVAPITDNEQNIIPEQSTTNNISNSENEKIEEQVVNTPITNVEINSTIPTMNDAPAVEPVNVEPLSQNISETTNAFNSKPIDIQLNEPITNNESIVNDAPVLNTEINENVPNTNDITRLEQVNIAPIEQNPTKDINTMNSNNTDSIPYINDISPKEVQTENVQPIPTGISEVNTAITTLEVEPQAINEIPVVKEENIIEQNKVCKNCGESMPSIVSICPKCGTDNE